MRDTLSSIKCQPGNQGSHSRGPKMEAKAAGKQRQDRKNMDG